MIESSNQSVYLRPPAIKAAKKQVRSLLSYDKSDPVSMERLSTTTAANPRRP